MEPGQFIPIEEGEGTGRRAFPWTRRDAALVVCITASFPLAFLLFSPPSTADAAVALPSVSAILLGLLFPVVFTAALCALRMSESRTSFASLFTLRTTPWKRALRHGLLEGLLPILPTLYLMVGTAMLLRYVGFESEPQPVTQWMRDANASPLLIGLLAVHVVIVAPVTEEILHRGILVTVLARQGSRGMAVFLSSVFFGLLHANAAAFPALALLGAFLAYGFLATGSLLTPIAMHALFNAVNVAFLLCPACAP